MTLEERQNPEIFEKQTSRISRVAKGSGSTTTEVRSLLKQWKLLQSMVKDGFGDMDASEGINQKQLQKMMKKLGKKKFMRF